jgi:hypothetical protein
MSFHDVEHKLQMVQDFQTHALPDSAEGSNALHATRGGYDTDDRAKGVAQFNITTSATGAGQSILRASTGAKTSPVFEAFSG